MMYEVRIIGKGNKERPVKPMLVGGAAQYLHEWLFLRGTARAALFCYITRLSKGLAQKGLSQDKILTLSSPKPPMLNRFRACSLKYEPSSVAG